MPHVARYFLQRAYDSVFEPCSKKSKTDHSASRENKSTVSLQEPEVKVAGAKDDILSGADYVPLSGTSKLFSADNIKKSCKSNHTCPWLRDDFLTDVDYVPLSGTSKHSSDNKNKSNKSTHVRSTANTDFLSSAEYVPLSGTYNRFSADSKNESYRGGYARPGTANDFRSGADYVPISGPSKHLLNESKNESYIGSHVRSETSKDFQSGADYVPISGPSKHLPNDNKNDSHKGSHVGSRTAYDFQSGADYVPILGPSKHLPSDNKNESYKNNNVRPGTTNNFLRDGDYIPRSGTSKHVTDDNKNESYKSNNVRPGPSDYFPSGADYVPILGPSKLLPNDNKNESYKSNQVRPGPSDYFQSGADYVPLSGTSKHFSADNANRSYKSSNVRPGTTNNFLIGADYVPISGSSKHFTDGHKNEFCKSNHVRPGASDYADYVSLSETSTYFADDNKNESYKSYHVRPGPSHDFLSGADYVPLSITSKHFSNDCKNELYDNNRLRPGASKSLNGADYVPLSETCKNYSSQCPIEKKDSDKNQHNLMPPETDRSGSDKGSEAAFSETSTAFIGPLCQPPPQIELVTKKSNNATNEPSSYKITTVEFGNSARRSNSKAGMDYELQAFYKELSDLEAATDDQSIGQITEHQQIPQYSNAPAVHANLNPVQTSAPQPCNTSPAKPPGFIPFNSQMKEDSPVKFPALPSNNHDTCNRLVAFKETAPPFVSRALPFPGFQAPPPPSFVLRQGPPPPRYDYPLRFPQENNVLPPPLSTNDQYYMVNHDHHRPGNQAPCPKSASPESRFSPQVHSYTKPLLEPPANFSQREHYQGDLGGWRGRPVGELSFPQDDHGPHEQYSHRFRDYVPYTHTARKLVLLRGVPGSGKSTLARTLLSQSPKGIVFSTDDYFCQENGYTYDVMLLGDAHSWNQDRARKAMDDGRSPIIIDNTNIQSWEMKPYVHMAIDCGYDVEFLEPNTWWKQDPNELEKRNTHRVPREKISQMLERYEPNMTVGIVMNSKEPRRVRSRPPPEARPRWGASVDRLQHNMSFHNR